LKNFDERKIRGACNMHRGTEKQRPGPKGAVEPVKKKFKRRNHLVGREVDPRIISKSVLEK
jgi:hypothetical protein